MKSHATARSFTLIELVIVLALLGIFASIVAVNAQGFGANAKLDSAARTASDVIALARNEARVSGRVWSIQYEVGGRAIKLLPPKSEKDLSTFFLPRGVQLRAAIRGFLQPDGSWASVEVRPDGVLTPHHIYIGDNAGGARTISPNPITGVATISQGLTEPNRHVLPSIQ